MTDRRPRFVRGRWLALLWGLAAAFLPVPADAAPSRVVAAGRSDLAATLRAVPRGGEVRIEGLSFDGFADAAGLDLHRFDVLGAGADIVVQGPSGPQSVTPPLPVYLRGSVDGLRGSVAVLSVRASGEVRGVVSGAEGTWMLSSPAPSASSRGAAAALRSRRADRIAPAPGRRFECETRDSPVPARTASSAAPSAAPAFTLRLPITYTAQVAVELDYDYFQLFAPDAESAILYALDLMAFTGVLGEAELGMNVQVPFIQLWTTSSDPYSGGTGSRLDQVRSRWNQGGASNCGGSDCTAIDRSTVILLSSEGGGGVAYVPGLCDSWHSPTGGFSYAMAGSLDGDFDIDSPSAVWDIVVTTHELGHNFGSHHTHCYSPPVDGCYGAEDGCYGGPTGLPGGCPGSGQGCGTIMSYCHLLGGGLGNVSLTYGAGHPYGDAPERVPATMINRLNIEAAAAPGCLAATGGMVELTVATAGGGSGTVTSSPAAIDCGDACRTYFDADTVVTLTPTAGPFSVFTGWSGDADCSDGEVTMSAATSCTATFEGSCGVGNEDCDDGDPCTLDTCPGGDHCENTGTPRDAALCFDGAKTKLKIIDAAEPKKNKLLWQWRAGDAFEQADLGNPTTMTDYTLCVYDRSAGTGSLATSLQLPAGGSRWKNRSPRGWKWSDRDAVHDGIKKVLLKPGELGKGKVKLLAAGVTLPVPGAFSVSEYFDQDPSVIVQLLTDDDRCWTSEFLPGGTGANTPAGFRANGN